MAPASAGVKAGPSFSRKRRKKLLSGCRGVITTRLAVVATAVCLAAMPTRSHGQTYEIPIPDSTLDFFFPDTKRWVKIPGDTPPMTDVEHLIGNETLVPASIAAFGDDSLFAVHVDLHSILHDREYAGGFHTYNSSHRSINIEDLIYAEALPQSEGNVFLWWRRDKRVWHSVLEAYGPVLRFNPLGTPAILAVVNEFEQPFLVSQISYSKAGTPVVQHSLSMSGLDINDAVLAPPRNIILTRDTVCVYERPRQDRPCNAENSTDVKRRSAENQILGTFGDAQGVHWQLVKLELTGPPSDTPAPADIAGWIIQK